MENTELVYFLIKSSFIGAISFCFMMIFLIADKIFPEKTIAKFRHSIHCAALLLIFDCLDYYFYRTTTNTSILLTVAATCYTLRICTVGFLVLISQRFHSYTYKAIYILMFVNAIVSFTSIKTGWLFYLDQDLNWKIGYLYFIPYSIILFYVYLMLKESFIQRKSNPSESVIIISVLFICFLANILELLGIFKLALANAYIICILFYYLCLNVQLYRRDTLTNLLNRRSFFQDLQRLNKFMTVIVSIDLSDLKYFNKTEGHKSGDKAILTVVDIINSCFTDIGNIYRTGGDEFYVLCKETPSEDVEKAIKELKDKVSTTRYKVACGYAICYPQDDYERIINIADEAMFNDKKTIKSKIKRDILDTVFKSVEI